jgi:hypothetical protein
MSGLKERLTHRIQSLLYRPFFIRLLNWEFWSFSVVYAPIYIIWIGLCLRARSFFFFAAANPGIKNGGFLAESKKEIHPLIPSRLHPKTLFVTLPANADIVIRQLETKGFSFPLIGKPDFGGRGRGVQALADESALRSYIHNSFIDFHIQEFVAYKKETGIFYYRYPQQENGHISGIVGKIFLSVKGDGHSRIKDLLHNNKRAILQWENLEKTHGAALDSVLPAGEEFVLVPYGNHARGAKFVDESHLADPELTLVLDKVCREIPGFYFGRLDIRFNSWEELRKGKKFSIIEVNGAGSEPTHIYDPRHSIFFAWKEIVRHWIILWRISRANHRLGHRYLSVKEGIQMFKEDKSWSKKLSAMAAG